MISVSSEVQLLDGPFFKYISRQRLRAWRVLLIQTLPCVAASNTPDATSGSVVPLAVSSLIAASTMMRSNRFGLGFEQSIK